MKIALCANTSWYIYNYRRNLISALQEQGHRVYVIAPFDEYSPKITALGVKYFPLRLHQISKNPVKELFTLLHLFTLIKKCAPDILLTFTVKCNLYTGFLNKLCVFTQIANISGLGELFDRKSPLTTLVCKLYNFTLKDAQKVFFQNVEDLNSFVRQNILPSNICERIPGSGVDLATFIPSSEEPHQKRRVFLMFGRLIPHKGYDLFLQAADELHRDFHKQAEFWILGIPDEKRNDSSTLFQRILTYHTQHIITYLPATDNVLPTLQQADVIVLPTQYNEGVPRSLLEAMACAKPIITTNWKGCRDTVEDGVNGFLVEKGNLNTLQETMRFFIKSDEHVLHKMGKAGRKKAENEFDEQFIIEKYLQAIDEPTPSL